MQLVYLTPGTGMKNGSIINMYSSGRYGIRLCVPMHDFYISTSHQDNGPYGV